MLFFLYGSFLTVYYVTSLFSQETAVCSNIEVNSSHFTRVIVNFELIDVIDRCL